jgi:hypothetical protein
MTQLSALLHCGHFRKPTRSHQESKRGEQGVPGAGIATHHPASPRHPHGFRSRYRHRTTVAGHSGSPSYLSRLPRHLCLQFTLPTWMPSYIYLTSPITPTQGRVNTRESTRFSYQTRARKLEMRGCSVRLYPSELSALANERANKVVLAGIHSR